MKQTFPLLFSLVAASVAALLFTSSFARADLVVVQQTEGAGQLAEMTMKFKGDKIRADVSPEVSVITDVNSGDMTTLNHAQRSYMIVSGSSSRSLMEQMRKNFQKDNPNSSPTSAPKLQATGKKEKINGYDTDEYTCLIGGMKVSYWIAKNFPDWHKLLDAMMKFQHGSLAAMARGIAPSAFDLPGMPIRTEVDMGGQKLTTTLESVKDEPLDESIFQVPSGYTEIKMPSFQMPTMPSSSSSPQRAPGAPTAE